jgi:hypothetical protein
VHVYGACSCMSVPHETCCLQMLHGRAACPCCML